MGARHARRAMAHTRLSSYHEDPTDQEARLLRGLGRGREPERSSADRHDDG